MCEESNRKLTTPTLHEKRKRTHLICNALVPKILALSYFVIYGVVTLSLFASAGWAFPPAPAPPWIPAPTSTIPFP